MCAALSPTIDFLDLTIYKGFPYHNTDILDTKTQLYLYQYMSFRPTKAIIKKECIIYIRTNTMYEATIHTFKKSVMYM